MDFIITMIEEKKSIFKKSELVKHFFRTKHQYQTIWSSILHYSFASFGVFVYRL